MGTDFLQVNFRMPSELKLRLETAAKLNNRSLTAEIIHRLQETLEMDEYLAVENINPDDGMTIRIQEALAERIGAAAQRMHRTREAQAISTLEAAYMPPPVKD